MQLSFKIDRYTNDDNSGVERCCCPHDEHHRHYFLDRILTDWPMMAERSENNRKQRRFRSSSRESQNLFPREWILEPACGHDPSTIDHRPSTMMITRNKTSLYQETETQHLKYLTLLQTSDLDCNSPSITIKGI
jgi:hypothetical protein